MQINSQTTVVYLVDDDPNIRDSLTLGVESIGLNIKSFASAEAFLSHYSPEQPGCLILDVMLPGMSGLELQAELSKRNISIPIIFISGNAKITYLSKAFRAGAVDFIEKPCDLTLLLARIDEALKSEIEYKRQQMEKSKNEANFASLSARENEILQLIIKNKLSSKEAAKKLAISKRTVEAHRVRIMRKLQAKSTIELVDLVLGRSTNIESALSKQVMEDI